MFRGIEYDFYQAIYFLFFLPLFLFLYWSLWSHRDRWTALFKGSSSLQALLVTRSKGLSFIRASLLAVTWICVTVALMQPKGNGRYLFDQEEQEIADQTAQKKEGEDPSFATVKRKAHDVIFLLDTSASMDLDDTRVGKTRLNYAKEIIEEVVTLLDGQSVALYAFTSEVTTLVPITHDYLFFRLILKRVGINEGDVAGTDLMEALEEMKSRHFPENSSGKLKTLIVLTDGGDTRLEILEGAEKERELGAIVGRLEGAEEKNLRVVTVGLGTKEGKEIPGYLYEGDPIVSSLDEELLKALAEKGRGRYYHADDYSSLSIAADINTLMKSDPTFFNEESKELERYEVERLSRENNPMIYDLYFQYPLGLGILSLAVALLTPEVRRRSE